MHRLFFGQPWCRKSRIERILYYILCIDFIFFKKWIPLNVGKSDPPHWFNWLTSNLKTWRYSHSKVVFDIWRWQCSTPNFRRKPQYSTVLVGKFIRSKPHYSQSRWCTKHISFVTIVQTLLRSENPAIFSQTMMDLQVKSMPGRQGLFQDPGGPQGCPNDGLSCINCPDLTLFKVPASLVLILRCKHVRPTTYIFLGGLSIGDGSWLPDTYSGGIYPPSMSLCSCIDLLLSKGDSRAVVKGHMLFTNENGYA